MQVYYFTRTNRSKKIAEALAERYGVTAQRIEDGKNWAGAIGFIKACFMSINKKGVSVNYPEPTVNQPIILVFPVWADTFPPAVKTFIDTVGKTRITAIPTSISSTIKDRTGFAKVIDLVGKEISAPKEL
ncbi:flavodoxin [Oscillospiraceae bacterium LTW-04]|nr:flavodoxin [Oscillospiraceae bacterium MB24-C1]